MYIEINGLVETLLWVVPHTSKQFKIIITLKNFLHFAQNAAGNAENCSTNS